MGLRQGDEQAFVDFARLHTEWLFRTALALTGNWHQAQDLSQVALTKIFVSWPRVQGADHPRAYARGVLVKTWLSERRRRSSTEVPRSVIDGSVEDFAESVAVLDALRGLRSRDRAVLVLRFLEGRTVAQTAADLDISESAVSTATARALSRARELLDEPVDAHDTRSSE